ncbi:condensin [Tricharina praecox]|uniref:condensin n=1 Tax=Tricharina praecox TaxID=43433 RepID=UPI00221E4EAA|nr:condensin [Tricharina praecox]KAI5855220.1 condensin [Tricharina praecox]
MDEDMEEDRVSFDLNASLRFYHDNPASVPCTEADNGLIEAEENPDSLTNAMINQILDPIIDRVAENPDAISRLSVLDTVQCLLKYFAVIPVQAAGKVLDIIVSGLSAEADVVNMDLDSDEQDTLKEHRELLEIYGFLLQWVIAGLEARNEKPDSSATAGTTVGGQRGKGKAKGKGKAVASAAWDSTTQLTTALEVMCKVLNLKVRLLRVFVTTSERDTFVSLFTRPVYLILENEQRVKNNKIKMYIIRVLCIAVKHHGHAFGAQTSIVQKLTYFEHLSEPMAEFLQILFEQYDYPQLVDEVLRELSNREFNSNDSKGPKSISTFIVTLSERLPRLVLKQMTLVVKLLEIESHNLRNAVIEVCGNLIVELTKDDERSENHKAQMNAFFDLLEERFLDVNPYCRSKTIQVYHGKLLDLETKFPKRRQKAADLACRSLKDKSSNVRRNAIKLLTKLLSSHPFSALHGGLLRYSEWEARLNVLDDELNQLIAPVEEMAASKAEPGDGTVDPELLDDATEIGSNDGHDAGESPKKAPPQPQQDHSEEITRLQLTRRYYLEALRFIETIHEASDIVMQLLSSKNKSEVIEAMDFFKSLDVYKVETAKIGIRRMLRLIWTKASSDEGKGVQTHLIETYKDLFFVAPPEMSENDSANYIARNMLSLTIGTTTSELTSLEQLMSKMMSEGLISDLVISKLWQIYNVQKVKIPRAQRRGAIIVLGMLALAEPEIVVRQLETIIRVGLGPLGRKDLGLAKYTCLALRHISPVGRKAKDAPSSMGKLPNDHPIMERLAALVQLPSESKDWYGMAEQAIGAIYALAKKPDLLCGDIIKRKTVAVFSNLPALPQQDGSEDQVMQEAGAPEEAETAQQSNEPAAPSYFPLSQLLFIVGHVAIKQIVHLELLELEFKRKKTELEKKKEVETPNGKTDEEQDELDLIGGTTEDDFTEGIAHVRERELLYGEDSLLARFGSLVTEICTRNTLYTDRNLQAQATLCMGKLMCVSAEYCEEHLQLLITIMERSTDSIVRNNAVIAVGDMAVCFNHLIDENTNFLYRRLNDNEASVKRTCLMTLTFLILAGQVKVKGQLGQMAKCLEDSDKRIADLARMFFTELATKDNAVYNHFVDMFSLLSAEEDLDEESMKRIVKFLASFIEKDKHAKQLSDKLAARLPRCETQRQWDEIAYALSLLPHKNEEIQKTVTGGFRVVQAAA